MHPDKMYLENWLWIPKTHVNMTLIKSSMVVEVGGQRTPLWRENDTHVAVPRHYYQEDELPPLETVDLRPTDYAETQTKSLITLRPMQREAHAAIRDHDGVAHIACGKGKTVLALHAAVERGGPVYVINDKLHILHQWKLEVLGNPNADPPEPPKIQIDPDRIGYIQGPPKKWTWDRDLVFVSIRTLTRHAGAMKKSMMRHPATIVWDEVHHNSAPGNLLTTSLFPGRRWGMTATAHRTDGAERAYMSHIGPILYENLEQDLVPQLVVIKSSTRVSLEDDDDFAAITNKLHEINHKKLARHVGMQEQELELADRVMALCKRKDRVALAITASKDHAQELHERHPGSCVLHGDIDALERIDNFHGAEVAFGTIDMAAEALNKKRLDALVILTAFHNQNQLTQAFGRIQRSCTEKKHPVVILIHHLRVPMLRRHGTDLIDMARRLGFQVIEVN